MASTAGTARAGEPAVPGAGDAAGDAANDAAAQRLQRIATRAAEAGPAAADVDVPAFVARYYAGVAPEDLADHDEEFLARAARSHLELAERRPAGTALVRVFAPTRTRDGFDAPHTAVEIVTDDMPFLVDSASAEIDRHGLGMHLVVHPVLRVRRDAAGRLLALAEPGARESEVLAESFLRLAIDRETDPAVLDGLRRDLERVLADVRAATGDWLKMLTALHRVLDALERDPPPVDPEELEEGKALLRWLEGEHFTFVGSREYELLTIDGEDHLRAVPGSGLGVLRNPPGTGEPPAPARLPPNLRRRARERSLLVISKANSRSTVHRSSHLDHLGIKKFDAQGNVTGEWRFLGLYTSSAYNAGVFEVPIVRRKAHAVMRRAGFPPASHSYKDLVEILERYPRDELFQISEDELLATALGILHLQERRRVRLFARRDPYDRFVSCLVFLPRDRYNTALRLRVTQLLTDAFAAESFEYTARVTESVLARLHFVLHTPGGSLPEVDVRALERRVAAAARSWTDDLRDALAAEYGEEAGRDAFRRYADAFPPAYQADVPATAALADLPHVDALARAPEEGVRLRLSRPPGAAEGVFDFRIFGLGPPMPLSEVMPLLQHMGVSVVDEHPYVVTPAGLPAVWVERFGLGRHLDAALDQADAADAFQHAFAAVLRGDAENDGLNRLVLAAGLGWREVAVLRAYCRYLRQAGTRFSQDYLADALVGHPDLARRLVALFRARFDPAVPEAERDLDARVEEIRAALDAVASLDEDRILRSVLQLVLATVRTNFFQDPLRARADVACKLDPGQLADLPRPRPMFEVFVYSPRVEGVHLRAGRVARGGVRWSDRREDFRTEILGLMKAQTVKNAVIVPVGAKGGFVVKQPPAGGDRAAVEVEAVACYRTFVSALLDLTDNLVAGRAVPPGRVVRYDGDDPYLVVAADKGTAELSDVANELALERGFWLGDAFASGGSTGYDHKRIGITARGAWESVRRHFRELGIDPDRTDFTVVGVGDMSGDVFGNGMLCSHHIRLVAAFDHRHVFLDPDPDPDTSYRERQRLFALGRSSWADYDPARLSPGGGVFPRTAKSIRLTPEVRARLAVDAEHLTPNECIAAILRAPVDLLWNGGIGTYVRATTETDTEVGDKANDPVRVTARSLRCRVVVEGGNLGLTQRGRVEFALAGGHLNTDAIDNSAGVDLSDHEVNVKILLDGLVAAGQLTRDERNQLLADMTGEVTRLVLRDNYRQNRALANARAQAHRMEDVHARYLRFLEQRGALDRDLDAIPDDEALADRRNAGLGLTVPELAVLLATTKIALEEELGGSDVPDDDFAGELERYFPGALRERFPEALARHPLRREIVATALANAMVNRAGTTFVFRLREETGATAAEITRAHHAAWCILDQDEVWRDIEALDFEVAAATQTEMYLESRKLVERATRWLLRHRPRPLPVRATIDDFAPGVRRVQDVLGDLLLGTEREWLESCTADLAARGVPHDLARRVSGLESLFTAFDIVEVARATCRPVEDVAAVHAIVGHRLELDWLRDRIVDLPRDDRWQALARIALREDAYDEHRALAAGVLAAAPAGLGPAACYERWAAAHAAGVDLARKVVDDVRGHGVFDLSTLTVALRAIGGLSRSRTTP